MNEPAQRQQEFPTGYTDLPRNTFVWPGGGGKEDTLGQGGEGGREKTLITKEGIVEHKSLLLRGSICSQNAAGASPKGKWNNYVLKQGKETKKALPLLIEKNCGKCRLQEDRENPC